MMNCFKHEKQIHQPSKMKLKKTIFFYTQKCVNKKTVEKSFSSHTMWEKNYHKNLYIAFSMKSFSARINYSHYYMMRRWNCLFLVDALFSDSIFFDPELLLLREIFISHSKNVVTQHNEKADKICPYWNCSICIGGCNISELLCKDIKYLIISQIIW